MSRDDTDAVLAAALLRHPEEGLVVLAPVHGSAGEVVDFVYERVNEVAERMAGGGEVAGRRVSEVTGELAEDFMALLRPVLHTGLPWSGVYSPHAGEHPDLEEVWLELYVCPFPGRLVARFRDVTAERTAASALAASERRFRALVEHAADVIQVYGLDGRVRYTSPALLDVLGYSPEQVQGWHYHRFVAAEDQPVSDAAFAGAVGAAPSDVVEFDVRVVRADGGRRWVSARGSNRVQDPAVDGLVLNWRDIHDRRLLQERLQQQALQDPLTALPNRRWFTDALTRALARAERTRNPIGVLLIDLDHFKLVNDTLGHPVGDALLVQVAERISRALRPTDAVARLGGDEFVVLAEDLHEPLDAAGLAERILSRATGRYLLGSHQVRVTFSIGVATATAGDTTDVDTLLAHADTALYEGKRRGRNRVEAYEPQLRLRLLARLELEQELADALDRDELDLYWQPIVRGGDGVVTAAEALLRWHHPRRGTLAAAQFLPLAQEIGVMDVISPWVFDRAMAQAAAWAAATPDPPKVYVNLSAQELAPTSAPTDLAGRLSTCSAAHGVDPDRVYLEVSEQTLAHDLPWLQGQLHALHEHGFHIALDDFGAGNTALAWMQQLPLDVLKLDGAFTGSIQDPTTQAVVSSVLQLASSLHIGTIAEGVETAAQHATLTRLGCRHFQGYHLARPGPAAELAHTLRQPPGAAAHWEA